MKKTVAIISVVFAFMIIDCSKGSTSQDKDFVIQVKDNMCGAYCIAYYKWLESGKKYSIDQSIDRTEVSTIYENTKFGLQYKNANIPGLHTGNISEWSSPLFMLNYIIASNLNDNAKYYTGSDKYMIKEIIKNDSSMLSSFSNAIFFEELPPLSNGQYAILGVSVERLGGFHWILLHKTSHGFEYYDPGIGSALLANSNQIKGIEKIDTGYRKYQSLNIGLLLPKN
jgi:hypothetical protein